MQYFLPDCVNSHGSVIYKDVLGRAVRHCEEIGREYHRVDRDCRVSRVCEILEELARIIFDPQTSQDSPINQVNKAPRTIFRASC